MKRQNLTNVYDCINRIARRHESQGRDRSAWFYTDAEFADIKKNDNNIIL